jgi:hypothetical protein
LPKRDASSLQNHHLELKIRKNPAIKPTTAKKRLHSLEGETQDAEQESKATLQKSSHDNRSLIQHDSLRYDKTDSKALRRDPTVQHLSKNLSRLPIH